MSLHFAPLITPYLTLIYIPPEFFHLSNPNSHALFSPSQIRPSAVLLLSFPSQIPTILLTPIHIIIHTLIPQPISSHRSDALPLLIRSIVVPCN
jgi:hypothetical protein